VPSPADPEVSVLLPVRDAAAFLPDALADLRDQVGVALEVLAIDDGSTDRGGPILDEAALDWPSLRVIHTAAAGLPAALEVGRELARAPWLGRMDADDRCPPHRFHMLLERARDEAGLHVIGSQLEAFGDLRQPMRRYLAWQNQLLDHEAIVRHRFVESPLMHATALLDAAMVARVGGWDPTATWSEDVDLWCRLAQAGARFAKVPTVLYRWRQHDTQATRVDPRCSAEQMRACKVHYLARGPLRGRRVALWSVGQTLRLWGELLRGEGFQPRAVELRPATGVELPAVGLDEVVLAVYGSPAVRERIARGWRGEPDGIWFAA
jgi:Glycosyl transferase family 2